MRFRTSELDDECVERWVDVLEDRDLGRPVGGCVLHELADLCFLRHMRLHSFEFCDDSLESWYPISELLSLLHFAILEFRFF